MGLKLIIAKLEDVPETVRGLYKAEGDKFVLDVEGAVAKERLDEFRQNNIALQQQLDALKGVDPAKYKELMDLDRKFREKQLIDAGKVDEVVNLRVTSMKAELDSQLAAQTTALDVANAKLSVLMIDNTVKAAALAIGVLPTALDDVVLRARGTYHMVDGAAVPKNAKGEVIYGKDGTSPMPPEEWITSLKKTAPHLFAGSTGSGAGGGDRFSSGDIGKMSPVEKVSYGLTQGAMRSSSSGF